MKKTSYVFIAVGVIIIAGLVYFLKPQKAEDNNNSNNTPIINEPVVREFVIEYRKSTVFEPKSYRVEEGQKVLIKVTSDAADEAHLHGYNLNIDLKPNVQATLEFTADKTGRFELELHETNETIGYLEVYPK